ncbi:MAG: hypothetical protein V7739_11300 [Motiliproteus sp.]
MGKSGINIDAEALIAEWEQRLAGYEVVACTERREEIPERLLAEVPQPLSKSLSAHFPALFISFDGLVGRRYSAFLLTEIEQVVIYYEKDGELMDEFIGLMRLREFWAFLASFPNIYRYLHHNALKENVH